MECLECSPHCSYSITPYSLVLAYLSTPDFAGYIVWLLANFCTIFPQQDQEICKSLLAGQVESAPVHV